MINSAIKEEKTIESDRKKIDCMFYAKKKSLKIKGLRKLPMTMKSKGKASKYRMRKQKSQHYQKITLRQ